MTDTDDTDDLLLIPPNFFTVKSDSDHPEFVQPYYNIVDKLIKQVGNLQNRIRSIESSESFFNNSLDSTFEKSLKMQNSLGGFRKYCSSDDLYIPSSNQSTPKKPYTKFKLNSLPNSPVVNRFVSKDPVDLKSPVGIEVTNVSDLQDSNTLNEIDTFLSKVKTIQRINAVRNLEDEFNDCKPGQGINNGNKEVASVLDDIDRQQKKLDRISKTSVHEPVLLKDRTWQMGDNRQSVPDLGAGVKETLYKQQNSIHQPISGIYHDGDHSRFLPQKYVSAESSLINESLTSVDKYPVSDSSSDCTQVTTFKNTKSKANLLDNPIHSNALNILNMHKQLLEDSGKKVSTKRKTRDPKPRSVNTVNSDLGLLNLADIWNANSQILEQNPSQAIQKLQEEKLRRQHCEDLIQQLQNRNLELQQKLSVALKVDESKNKVIDHFQEALEKIVYKMHTVQKEKRDWESEMSKLRSKHAHDIEEISHKLAYYEKELSKTMNLVHTSQEKVIASDKKCSELENEKQIVEKKYREMEEMLKRETEKCQQLSDILSQKEIEINENKNALNHAKTEVMKSRRAVEMCQEEFSKLKTECDKLERDLKDEKEQNMQLRNHKQELMKEVDDHKKREKQLQDELGQAKKQLENNRVELRNFYQGQVEILVQNKLKEFQAELDKAEVNFKEEIKKREMSIAKTAAVHIQQISEKYSLEIKLIEKKHQEETKLHQIQTIQYRQQLEQLQGKMDQFQEKRVLIAKQLQHIMETQWSEALRIIASGKSPTMNDDTFSTIDQLNSLKTKSYNNVEEVLSQHDDQLELRRSEKDSRAAYKDGMEKVNQKDLNIPMDTPVSSRGQEIKQFSEHDIQKYISLLLNKQSTDNHQEGSSKALDRDRTETERAPWTNVRTTRFS